MNLFNHKTKLLQIAVIIAVLYLQHIQLIYSASINIRDCLTMNLQYLILNMMISVIPYLLFSVLLANSFKALTISSSLIFIYSLINYHVFLFHGSPFLASDVYSIATAVNVMSAYHPVIDGIVIRLIILFALQCILLYFLYRLNCETKSKNRLFPGIISIIDIILIWMLFFSKSTLFPSSLVSWSWAKPMQKYGYEVCFVNSIYTTLNKYSMMDGYDPIVLEKYISDTHVYTKHAEYPDIIVILNESLCDLEYTSDIPEGAEALQAINSIPDIISGYTIVPLIGGGTNCSEYELLTSNSFYQISTASPFAALDMNNTDNIAKYLKSIGYKSAAMHCYSETNYARDTAYPALGFDETYLGKDMFTYSCYENREWLDTDNYKDMLSYYEALSDSPRFMYLLTFQNHGGYEQNSPEADTINVEADYGPMTDDVNEYLSSIEKSSHAFGYLIDELSKSERPVIVLMVGDHAPSFIAELPVSTKDNVNSSIIQRTVPYYIWSNTQLDPDAFVDTSTLTDLIPMILDSAGMPLSPYYELINQLHESVPVRTSDGLYYGKNNDAISYTYDSVYYEMIRDYYFMEYNSLNHGNDYLPGLFAVQK